MIIGIKLIGIYCFKLLVIDISHATQIANCKITCNYLLEALVVIYVCRYNT